MRAFRWRQKRSLAALACALYAKGLMITTLFLFAQTSICFDSNSLAESIDSSSIGPN